MTAVEEFRAAIDGTGQALISGEVQFWRMEPEQWEPALRAVRDLGIRHVATYLSWRRHEPVEGTVDFSGGTDPRLDVKRFLRLCRDLDLSVQLKPGPWICAEEPGGGFPDWLLVRDGIMARDHAGEVVSGYNPPFKHPMPSYASSEFRELVRAWIQRVWGELEEFTGADGPVVATQLDNEPSLGFQDSMYGFDYHPEAIAAFQLWVARHPSSADATPPRPGVRTSSERAWVDYQQAYISEYLSWLRGLNASCGVGHLVDFVNLNTHPVRGVPQNGPSIVTALRQAGATAVVGEDHYFEPPVDLADLAGLALACAQGTASATRLVWAPEMQSGIWRSPGEQVAYDDPTPADLGTWWGAGIAFGYRGFNLYMLVDRENWEFAPLSPEGAERPAAAVLRRFLRTVGSVSDLAAYRPAAQVNLAWSADMLHRAYRTTGTQSAPRTPWTDADELRGYSLTEQVAAKLVAAGVQFRLCRTPDDADPGLPTVVDSDEWPGLSGSRVPLDEVLLRSGRELRDLLRPPVAGGAPGTLARMHVAPDGRMLCAVVVMDDAAESVLEVDHPGIAALRDSVTGEVQAVVDGRVRFRGTGGLHLFHCSGQA